MTSNENVYAAIERRYPGDLDGVCIETLEGLTYSWRDLHLATGCIANWLNSLKLKRGDRVAVQVEKSPECLMLYLATLRAGLVYVPLNTAYQRAELDYFLRDAEPAVVVCTPSRLTEIEPIARGARCRQCRDIRRATRRYVTRDRRPVLFRFRYGAARCRRSGRDFVHVGHHWAQQGRDAVTPQSDVERDHARSILGVRGDARRRQA